MMARMTEAELKKFASEGMGRLSRAFGYGQRHGPRKPKTASAKKAETGS